jgi:hypothetical protein
MASNNILIVSNSKLLCRLQKPKGVLTYPSFFRDCLTSANWSVARNQIHHAIEQHTIDTMIVIGSAGIFCHTSDHLFWQYELTFVLAIFELGKL